MTDDLQRGDDLTPAPNAQASEQSGDQAIHPSNDQREVALGQAEAPLLVSRPAAGQSVVLDPAPDQIVVLNFDPAAAQVQVEAGNLVLGFDDDGNGSIDSRIVFLDLAAEGGESAIFQIAGTEIDSSVLVGQALALAGQDEAPLGDVAAGPGATSGGGSAYDDNLGNVLDLLVAQGVIPPTTLQFGLIDLEDSPVAVDEAEGVISLTFRSIVDDGEGGVTTFEGGFEDWQPDQDGCEGATVPMEVLIAFTPNDNEELVSFSLSGIPEGATLFVGGTAAANAVDTSGGSSPLLSPADLATGIYLLPPEDSGDDIPLTVTATISDPDSGDTSVISGTATAIIDSVADNPFALFDGLADGFEGFDGGEGASEEEIEAFLGLESGALDAAANDSYGGNGTEEATDGTAIKTTLNLQTGDRVEMTFNFLDAEGSGPGGSYQDFAFVSVNGEVFPIASVGSANEDSDAFYLGSGLALQWNEESGYFTLSVTAEAGGSYELGIGVMNEGDTAVDSGLLVDNLIVTRGEDVVFQDDFTSFDNWEVLTGGFTAIVGDVNTNEDMPGAPSQGLLIATGPFDLSAAGCEVITSYIGYNEDNGTPVFEGGEGQGGDDCAADEEPIFGAGFIAAVTDGDGSESLTKITISTFVEGEPGGSDPHGLEVALSGEDDPAATNFMVGEQVLVDGGTVEVMATFADGSTGSVTATIEIADGVLTLLFDGADRVQSVDLSSGSATPFQVRLPQHSDDDFQLNLEVTATEYDIDGELTLDNNEATHQAVLNVEVKAVADGAEVNAGVGSASFVEDGEADPANHGADSGETGLEIPLETLGATLVDRDGSEAITELKVTLQGADAGATFIGADGEPLGATLQVEVADGVFITADVAIAGQTLTLTFGEDAAGYDIDVSGLVQVKLPVDDSDDFTVKLEATTTEVHPEGDVACESKTTETSFDVHVGGIAGPAAVAFGDYANFPGCGAPTVEGNSLTLSLFEDGQGAVEGQAGEGGEAGPQVVPLFFTAAPQDADGSEKITQVTLSLDGAAEGTVFVAEGTPLAAGDEVAGATVSFDGDTLVLTFDAPGADAIDLSAIGVQVPQHSDDDFAVQIATTTTEYDDDGSGAAVTSHETAATINVMLDAVADPVTVDITVNDSLADVQNQFSPGETGSVKVEAGFGDVDDGSETHTVTVEIPEGFTVGALDELPEGVTAEVNGDGNVVFTVGAGVAALDYTFEVTAPDDVIDEDLFGFTATAKAEETSTGDAECSEENNLATAVAEQEVSGEAAGTPEVGLQVDGESGVKEDAQTEVQITADVTTVGDTLSQVVVTAPAGWVLNATAGGDIASVAGDGSNSLTLTLTGGVENFAGTILATPPADTDVDAEFTVTATAVDGLDSAEGSDDFPVTVDAILDEALELGADGSASGDEAAAAQTFSLNLDSSVVAPFTGSGDGGADTDGSESTTVTLTLDSPLPAGALLSTTAAGATVTDNGGSYTISGPDLEAAIDGLQVQVPGGFEGVISGTVSAESREANTPQGTVPASGQEPDTSDNVSTDSVDFTVTVTGGEVAPEAAIGLPEGVAAIKEDSSDNVVEFSASADNATDELTSVVIELPGVAQGDVNVAQIVSDLSGNGSVLVSEAGGTTSITITFADASDVQDFASSFTLDAPVEDSDLDLSGVKITAHAKDITDPLATGSDAATTTIVVDAVLDEAGAATQGTAPSESESGAAQEINLDLSLGFVSAGFALSGAGDADEDGSEAVTAVTVTLSEGVLELGAGAPAGSSLTDNGGGSYTLNVADADDYADAIAALQVEVPAGYEGTVTGSISVTTEEVSPNGGEPDTSDNVRTLENQFSATVTGGTVTPTAAIGLAGQAAAIKEDSTDNQVDFTANAGDATDELTSVVIELPGVAQGDVDVAQIVSDLSGNGTAVVSEAGGTTTITITFDAGSEPGSFASSFTLDAPVEDSDVDLSGVKITAHAQDKTDNTEIGQGGETTTIVVDAVLDQALELGADGATGGSEQATPQTLGLGLDATLGSAGFGLSLAGGADGDGSEITTVTLTLNAALPTGASLTTTAAGATITGGPLVYTISGTDLAAAVDGLQVQVPGGYEGVISGTVSSASREANTPEGTQAGSGLEPDTSDNTASDSVNFTVTVTGGDVTPTAALALASGGDCIKEDSTDNQVDFTANAGDATDELTSVVIELPGVAQGHVDVAQIVSDLAGNGTVSVSEAGGTTTITITFDAGSEPGSFASSFTLDAPVEDSDVDLSGVKITAHAQDEGDNTETGQGGETTTIVVDAVLDQALELGADGATGGSEQATPQTLGLGLDATLGSAGFGLSLAGGADGDGSESTTVTLTLDNPLPAGAVLSSTAGTLSGGPLVYTISGTDLAAAVDGLQVQVPGGYEGVISGTVSSASREANTPEGTVAGSGLEPDTSDNTASDSVNFTATVTGGDVTPTAALALASGGDCIKEDSTDNQVNFTANAGDGTDELTSVVIELPGVATGDVDVAQIVSDLAGNGSVLVNEAGGTTTITVTFFDGSQPGSFASSFTLDAPVADSDLDLQGLQITAYAQDKTDNTETGSGGETIDIVVDAVADGETDGLSVAIEVKDSGDAGAEFAPGETGTVKVSARFGDSDDGSEAHTVVVDVPDDFTVGQPLPVTPAGVTASVNADGDVEFVVQNGTAGFTDYVFEVTASNAIADPDSYTFTATAKAVEQNSNSDPEAGDLECTTGDNEATATAQDEAEVEPVETLAGKIVINEVGLGVSEAQTVDFPGQGQDDFHVDAGLNFIEIRNIANNASGVNGQAIEQLDIEIVGPDGTKVTIDLSTLSGSVGSHGLAAKEYLVLYEDGTWAVYDAGGELKNANSFGSYTSNAPWGFGETTSDELAINMMQEVAGGTFAHVDGLLANGADTGSLTHTAGAIWEAAGDGSTAAQALFGDVVDNAQFNGQIGDQWSVLGSILAPGQAVLSDPESLGQAVNDGVDDATKVFARVYSDNVPGQAQIPGDTVNGGDPEMDSDQELDWTTSNQSTQGGINQASGDLNPQDDTDDFDPAQGAGSNDENAGQTVVDVSEGGEADTANEADDNLLEGGRGQDFLFGDDDANTLLGGDHNDFLFGDKGDDRLEGEGGADLLTDVDGEDVLIGGAGDDVLIGGEERLDGSVAVSDASGDLLVGDNVIEGEVPTFNVVYVIDVSGSMAWAFDGDENPASGESRLDYAKQAFLTLNQQIIDAGFAGVVNIKVVPFASSASDAGSPEFDRADDAALESFINGLTANGGTQYESPLQVAANWLREDVGGTERHEGSQNFVFFLSDGGDNNGYNPNSGSLGTDLYGADPAISNLTIEAFGFGEPGASDFSADELGEVETGTTGNGDQVVIVDDVSKIDQIFSGISLSDDDLGEDVILAGSGNDMIFGDTLVVDPAFVGSEADYAAEIFNDEEGAALRLPLDTIGLADWIEGGAGNDSIMGQAGDDTIMGQAGDDLVYGGDGDDLVHHDLAEETTGAAGNHYDGGRGSDKLVLNLASSDLSDPAVVQAVQDLIAFIAANSDPASGSGSGLLGSFAALGLEVRNFEELEILVDGQAVAPNAESFTLVTNQSGTFSVEADHIAHFGDDGLGGPVALGGVAGAASYTFPDAQAEVSGNFTYTVANDSLELSDPAAVTLVEDSDDTTLTGTAGRDLIIASGGVLTDNVTVSGAVAAGNTFDTGDDQFSFTLSTGVPGLSITEIVIDLGGGDFDEIGNNGNDFTTGPSNTVAGVSSAVTDGYSTLTITIPAGNFADGDVLTFGIDTDGSKTQTGGDFGDEGIPVTITLSDGTVLSGNYVDGPGSGDNDTSALTITGVAQSTIPSYLLEGQDGDDLLLGSEFGDSLDGGLGNDLLNGGAGDDVLTGGDGADTFAFVYGGFEADTITDFDLAEGDVLDLSDLLGGSLEGADGSQLDDYLSIAVSGGNTIITYETDGWSGPGGPNDGTITLTGVDLESIFGTSSDSQIIDDLLANNALVVD